MNAKLIDSLVRLNRASTPSSGSLKYGFVVNVHLDESDVLFGTVDVQEYTIDTNGEPNSGEGLYEGVKLSAIQDITIGVSMVPKLYSDVVFTVSNSDNTAYIRMVSQVDVIRFESGEKISISAIDRGKYDPEVDDDIDEMESTGNEATLDFEPLSIRSSVQDKDGWKNVIEISNRAIGIEVSDGSKKSSVKMSNSSISVETDKAKVEAGESSVKVDFNGTTFEVSDGKVVVNAKDVQITGGSLTTKGVANTDMMGPYCAIPTCPFSGAPHSGSKVQNT